MDENVNHFRKLSQVLFGSAQINVLWSMGKLMLLCAGVRDMIGTYVVPACSEQVIRSVWNCKRW